MWLYANESRIKVSVNTASAYGFLCCTSWMKILACYPPAVLFLRARYDPRDVRRGLLKKEILLSSHFGTKRKHEFRALAPKIIPSLPLFFEIKVLIP